MVHMQRVRSIIYILLLHISCFLCADQAAVNIYFHDVCAQSPYALLLKEFIRLSDAIGLLRQNLPEDERVFVEDSVLGKIVRAEDMLKNVDFDTTLPEDVDYLFYWLSIASAEPVSDILHQHIAQLKRCLKERFDD